MSQCCGKIPSTDDVNKIRESIENRAEVEWIVEFDPPADSVEIKIDEVNHVDRITAKYDEKGYLHVIKVYTEEKIVNGDIHKEGDTHQTLSFPEQKYRISQDFDSSGKPIPGTAHITDQITKKVVWRENR